VVQIIVLNNKGAATGKYESRANVLVLPLDQVMGGATSSSSYSSTTCLLPPPVGSRLQSFALACCRRQPPCCHIALLLSSHNQFPTLACHTTCDRGTMGSENMQAGPQELNF